MKERLTKRKVEEFKKDIEFYEYENWETNPKRRLGDEVTGWNIEKWISFVLDMWDLPEKVKTFVWTKCQFHTFNESLAGRMITIESPKTKYLILIQEKDPLGKSIGPNIAATIAHEIAHAWLGHRVVFDKKQARVRERDANEQVKAWGVPWW